MKNLRKSVSVFLAVAMILCMFSTLSFSVSAAETKNTITVSSNVAETKTFDYDSGCKEFEVSYLLQSDTMIMDTEAMVSYDSSVLQLISTESADVIPVLDGGNAVVNFDSENDAVYFNATTLSLFDFTESAVYFTAKFSIVGSGDTAINLNVDIITGTTATDFTTVETAEDVVIVEYDTINSDLFTMTVDGKFVYDDITINLVAPKSTFGVYYDWSSAVLYYGNSTANVTKLNMTATDEVFYTSSVGNSTVINAGDWKVYSIKLTSDQINAINEATMVGFAKSDLQNRTYINANILSAGVDSYVYPYSTEKMNIADLDGYTFLIKDNASSSTTSCSAYVGYWMSDYVTVKMASPVAQYAYYNWDSVDLYYNDAVSVDGATKLTMFNTKETTKVEDVGSSTLIRGGRWYIHALSIDAQTATAIEASTVVGFAKTGVDANRTNLMYNVLKAKTDTFDGTYNSEVSTLADLEGQIFVIQDASRADSAGQYVGEWQTAEKYTQGKDDTITIYFAAPKGVKEAYDWSTGVELYYGSTALYKETSRLEMTKTDATTNVTVDTSLIPTLASGDWDIYSLTLTVDQIKAIDESTAAGFVKKDSFNRTSIFSYRHLGKASSMAGDVKYRGIKQSMETFDGYTFVICDHYPTSDEPISYQGSWVVL